MKDEQVTLVIDGKTVSVRTGGTILEAALSNGIYIPNLCYHENLRHTASCRLCMVRQEGKKGVVAACAVKAEEGMVIDSKDALAENVRKLSVDLMFKTHPSECTGCPKFGHCQFQSISQFVGDTGRRLRANPIRIAEDARNPIILHEMTRCILCGRCVRACEEMRGVGAIRFEKVQGRLQVVVDGNSLQDADCRFCSACVEVCPTGAIREHEAITQKMTGKSRTDALVPCRAACPAHIDIPKYLRFIREKNYSAAAAVMREKVPFPHALGYICTHRCELECKRNFLNEPVAIRDLKRHACEHDDGSWKTRSFQKSATGKKVAIIGAGPAGLTAAMYLAKLGHEVTIYEERQKAGGMMQYGIPQYRLPREIVDREIGMILELGVKLQTGVRIEFPASLISEGFDAVLVAVGAHKGARLPLKGAGLEGVYTNIEFLRQTAEGEAPTVGKNVIILGGGNVALDCAGIAKRFGAETVHLACLESRNKMTASPEELRWAEEEGVLVHNSRTFLAINGSDDGKVNGLRMAEVKGFQFDENGRSVIDLIPGSETILPVDTVIFAVGQGPDLAEGCGLALGRGSRIVVEANSCASSIPGIFAAGDCVTGTDSVIRAIAGARLAASEMDRFLGGDGNIEENLSPEQAVCPRIGAIKGMSDRKRKKTQIVAPEERCQCFDPMDLGYSEAQVPDEAQRCLQCDLRLEIAAQKFWNDYSSVARGE
jgi:formate dehydrogenase beta subunit